MGSPVGVLRMSSDRDDRMGAKIKNPKNPKGFKQNPTKSLDQNLTPKKSHAKFPSYKNLFPWTMQPGYVGTIMNHQIALTQKNPYLNHAMLPLKIRATIFQPQKSFDHPSHLKSGVPAL